MSLRPSDFRGIDLCDSAGSEEDTGDSDDADVVSAIGVGMAVSALAGSVRSF